MSAPHEPVNVDRGGKIQADHSQFLGHNVTLFPGNVVLGAKIAFLKKKKKDRKMCIILKFCFTFRQDNFEYIFFGILLFVFFFHM